jgi:hypothetical protein
MVRRRNDSRFLSAAGGMAYRGNRSRDGAAPQAAPASGAFFFTEAAPHSGPGGFAEPSPSSSGSFAEPGARIVRTLARPVLHEAFEIAVDDGGQYNFQRDKLIATRV